MSELNMGDCGKIRFIDKSKEKFCVMCWKVLPLTYFQPIPNKPIKYNEAEHWCRWCWKFYQSAKLYERARGELPAWFVNYWAEHKKRKKVRRRCMDMFKGLDAFLQAQYGLVKRPKNWQRHKNKRQTLLKEGMHLCLFCGHIGEAHEFGRFRKSETKATRGQKMGVMCISCSKKASRKNIDTLSDNYVKLCLAQKSSLSAKDFPPELVDLKRQYLKLRRLKKGVYGTTRNPKYKREAT
jgi:hypothetical protein